MRSSQNIMTSRMILNLLALCIMLTACTAGQPSSLAPVSSPTFVTISTPSPLPASTFTAAPTSTPKPEASFQVNGKPFKFLAAYIPGWYWGNWSEANDVALITQARQAGITVFHLMPPLYEVPLGTIHEDQLKHLDHFMDIARQNDLYVMFLLTSGLALSRQDDLPFSNPDGFAGIVQQPKLRQAYKDYVARVITRVNTVNGQRYSEDPTILSWMLVEEFVSAPFNYPKGFPKITAAEIADWVQENAVYIKTLDHNHLVCINTTAVMDTFDQMNQDWTPIFTAQALDFVEIEDAEARIRDFPDQMHMFDILFTLNKPIVIMVAFDSGAVDQEKVCADYQWQADAIRQVIDLYLARETAGFTINYWGANTYSAPQYDRCYDYTIDNSVIVSALKDVAARLGEMNVPPNPLDFVRLLH